MKHPVFPNAICLLCRQKLAQARITSSTHSLRKRLLSTTTPALADTNRSPGSETKDLLSSLPGYDFRYYPDDPDMENISLRQGKLRDVRLTPPAPPKPHRLHIFATRHNCHITLARGNRDALISVSAGNLGFRKAQRGTYDAAYQLGTFVMGRIRNSGMLSDDYPGAGGPIKSLEVVLRDFGPGREAVTKILLGTEGRGLRSKILRVMDSTRLKFGGTRSPKPRRLG